MAPRLTLVYFDLELHLLVTRQESQVVVAWEQVLNLHIVVARLFITTAMELNFFKPVFNQRAILPEGQAEPLAL